MRKAVRIGLAALVLGPVLVLTAWPVLAHHGSAAFDYNHTVTLNGTVTEFQFYNPHVLIYLDRRDPRTNNVQHCVVEWVSPRQAMNAGWNRTMMKTGDQISFDIHPGKNGTCIGRALGSKIAVNGKTFGH